MAFHLAGADRSSARLLTHGLQVLLIGLAAYTLVSFKIGELLNIGIPLALALVPLVLRYEGYQVEPVLGLWIALAATLHVLGMLGLYRSVGWFDQVAHAVSASLVAGVGFAVILAIDRYDSDIVIPPRLRAVFLFVFAAAFGVLWEIAEFGLGLLAHVLGGQALLIQYGLRDTVLDLAFNSIGALLVAAFGTQYFRHLAQIIGLSIDFDRE